LVLAPLCIIVWVLSSLLVHFVLLICFILLIQRNIESVIARETHMQHMRTYSKQNHTGVEVKPFIKGLPVTRS
jgi:hypothetical protein